MINKRNIWFFTLFSLIIVLSVYYITMPNELNLETNTSKEIERVSEEVNDSTVLVALRVEKEEEYITEVESLRTILTSGSSTIEEKNNAYEKIQNINIIKGEEEKLEKQIEELTNSETFVKIDKDHITIVVDKSKHDKKLANKIMRKAQSNYKNKMYITVKFQSSKN
ncbi:MAG: SpoIIIAH-like family protein [Bacilli bacterium]|nr:SpoIIIAH-like family protein [Bacilli bacterium]